MGENELPFENDVQYLFNVKSLNGRTQVSFSGGYEKALADAMAFASSAESEGPLWVEQVETRCVYRTRGKVV